MLCTDSHDIGQGFNLVVSPWRINEVALFYICFYLFQWDIVCGNRYLDAITDSLFFVGFFLGSAMSGPVNDW